MIKQVVALAPMALVLAILEFIGINIDLYWVFVLGGILNTILFGLGGFIQLVIFLICKSSIFAFEFGVADTIMGYLKRFYYCIFDTIWRLIEYGFWPGVIATIGMALILCLVKGYLRR